MFVATNDFVAPQIVSPSANCAIECESTRRLVISTHETVPKDDRRSQTVSEPHPATVSASVRGIDAEHGDELPEASQHHHGDDRQTVAPEPSIETIIKRIRARSEGSSGDAQNGRVSLEANSAKMRA